jgi:hypothetical protein
MVTGLRAVLDAVMRLRDPKSCGIVNQLPACYLEFGVSAAPYP